MAKGRQRQTQAGRGLSPAELRLLTSFLGPPLAFCRAYKVKYGPFHITKTKKTKTPVGFQAWLMRERSRVIDAILKRVAPQDNYKSAVIGPLLVPEIDEAEQEIEEKLRWAEDRIRTEQSPLYAPYTRERAKNLAGKAVNLILARMKERLDREAEVAEVPAGSRVDPRIPRLPLARAHVTDLLDRIWRVVEEADRETLTALFLSVYPPPPNEEALPLQPEHEEEYLTERITRSSTHETVETFRRRRIVKPDGTHVSLDVPPEGVLVTRVTVERSAKPKREFVGRPKALRPWRRRGQLFSDVG